jgi:hypothetical protein
MDSKILRFVFFVLPVGALFFVMGCQTVGNPHQADIDSIKTGSKSVVLFRMTMTTGNDLSTRTKIPFVVMDFTSLNQLDAIHPRYYEVNDSVMSIPSTADGKQGWGYLLMAPGDYYVKVHAHGGGGVINEASCSSFLHVPKDRPVIYAGSFKFDKEKEKQNLFEKIINLGFTFYKLEGGGIQDESSAASRITRESLTGLGGCESSLAVPYDDLSVATLGITNRQILLVESGRGAAMTSSDVGADAATMVASPFAIFSRASFSAASDKLDQGDAEGGLVGGAVGVAAIVVALPAVIVADQTFGEAARKKWAPYAAALAKEYNQFNLPQQLVNETSNCLALAPPATDQVVASRGPVIQIQAYRVLLRETRHRKFALEIAVCVTLVDPVSKTPRWIHDYVYSDFLAAAADPSFLPAEYETLINAQSEPHALEDYENASGGKLLHEQLAKAVVIISRDVTLRLHHAGFY